jgi:hypothetical protein
MVTCTWSTLEVFVRSRWWDEATSPTNTRGPMTPVSESARTQFVPSADS